jgi:hypothetical protein
VRSVTACSRVRARRISILARGCRWPLGMGLGRADVAITRLNGRATRRKAARLVRAPMTVLQHPADAGRTLIERGSPPRGQRPSRLTTTPVSDSDSSNSWSRPCRRRADSGLRAVSCCRGRAGCRWSKKRLSLRCAPASSPEKICSLPRPRSRTYSAVQRPMPRSCFRRSIATTSQAIPGTQDRARPRRSPEQSRRSSEPWPR